MNFPSLQDIESLERDEQIETIKKLRLTNRIHEMAEGFGFKSSSMYYNWLKKLQIYEDLCGKKSVFNPVVPRPSSDMMHAGSSYALRDEMGSFPQSSQQIVLSQDEMKFKYELTASGSQTAALLRKIAAYIEDEESDFKISLCIEK
ncbi:hypothetical protein M5X00_21415 [Paenibacillus alvei]|uniref:Uncharacterized protein n=1 Tax=Paenibacillus alvei TaxID=44250 RepID=A0AAP6ZTK9_PAEAL|nr:MULTISPECIES: hypothetical protein [Paenibacillus]EJW19240.1 hypothetical protein PAV_1c02110 [Paenibacillus alvei DSM 29]MBG9734824.1 hypothetical protein [Paenibacillus alvei]MBG9744699.1 hypothetical protein [Paenibacillus alvei]MCY7483623.1 hypothetical protein [Paenibacillus alvei]MCY9542620.1 hypothetical protein [Paenibacillus alvei]